MYIEMAQEENKHLPLKRQESPIPPRPLVLVPNLSNQAISTLDEEDDDDDEALLEWKSYINNQTRRRSYNSQIQRRRDLLSIFDLAPAKEKRLYYINKRRVSAAAVATVAPIMRREEPDYEDYAEKKERERLNKMMETEKRRKSLEQRKEQTMLQAMISGGKRNKFSTANKKISSILDQQERMRRLSEIKSSERLLQSIEKLRYYFWMRPRFKRGRFIRILYYVGSSVYNFFIYFSQMPHDVAFTLVLFTIIACAIIISFFQMINKTYLDPN